ncbi:MAG: TIGR02757 family protein [Candidatus Cloacimonadota bacterium]|nr:MAG: TIGR02757 family protein [Candidatus Cloacimonadota bacterium]
MDSNSSIYDFLEQIVKKYNRRDYLDTDPVSIVHKIKGEKSRETAAFISSVFAFGNVKTIKATILKVLHPMGNNVYDFIKHYEKLQHESLLNSKKSQRSKLYLFQGIGHRFIKGNDISCLVNTLHFVLKEYGSIENLFMQYFTKENNLRKSLEVFTKNIREIYCRNNSDFCERTLRFMLPSPEKGSACKRMNLFLRWMVRKDEIDLGIWKGIKKNELIIPLDTHIARISKSLGFTKRKTLGWNMANEITENLKKFDPLDPLKYDFALTRIGMLKSRIEFLQINQ